MGAEGKIVLNHSGLGSPSAKQIQLDSALTCPNILLLSSSDLQLFTDHEHRESEPHRNACHRQSVSHFFLKKKCDGTYSSHKGKQTTQSQKALHEYADTRSVAFECKHRIENKGHRQSQSHNRPSHYHLQLLLTSIVFKYYLP